jgi:hypothetical protein
LTVPGLEIRSLGFQPVASRYTDCVIPAHEVLSAYTLHILCNSHQKVTRKHYCRVV